LERAKQHGIPTYRRSDSACWLPDHIKPQSGRAFFYGMKVHEAVYESGVKYTGCTVHFVDAGVDAGPIILQEVVRVEDDDTPDTIAEKVLQLEHRILPTAIKLISEGRVMVNGRRVCILPASSGDSEGRNEV